MFYPRLFNEGIADKYAEKEFYIPQEIKGQEDLVARQAIRDKNRVIHSEMHYAIIKNPVSLQNFAEDVRMVFSKEGNLYVVSTRNLVHSLLVEILVKMREIEDQEKWWWRNPKNFVTLERVGKTNDIAVGESNDTVDPELDEHTREHYEMPYFEECEAYFQDYIDKANKLFPQFNFINKHKKYLNQI